MAITRLWFFSLRPGHQATDPAFLALWAEILELLARYTPAPGPTPGPQVRLSLLPPARQGQGLPQNHHHHHHHFLLQSRDDPALLVLVSSYPSLALCRRAEAAYREHGRYRAGVRAASRHRALRQLDMEDAEVVPALLEGRGGGGGGDGDGDGDGGEGVTLTISSRNPLGAEIAEARSARGEGAPSGGGRSPVLPTNREISGLDVYEAPPAPAPAPAPGGGEVEEEVEDLFAEQRREGKRWIRIRRGLPTVDDGVEEVFQLRELLSR